MILPDEWHGTIGVGRNDFVTAEEIAAHPEWRGQYVAGTDTRDFIALQEHACEACNCWMVRGHYLSEPPSALLAPSDGNN